MLVTFRSDAWSNITLFGEAAVTLLKMAGHSGTVPGALLASEIPAVLKKLKLALAASGEVQSPPSGPANNDDADAPPPVGLRLRAYPLIELLSAAAEQNCDVIWEAGAPL